MALLGGVGLATAAVAIRITDASVDRSLRDAATAAITYLELVDVDAPATPTPAPATPSPGSPAPTPTPSEEPTNEAEPSGEPEPTDSATQGPGSSEDEGENESGAVPASTNAALALAITVASSAPLATVAPDFDLEPDDQPPAASDTFFLVLDARGQLISNPRRVLLAGLPDAAAAAAAATTGEDWRTVTADGAPVRLFTKRVSDGQGGPPALLQSGMVLSLHEVQRNEILWTIALASLLGFAGAGLITLLVTRRALAPIRSAFAAERRFVAAASHELRTPVAVVHALAEVLQREAMVLPEGRQVVDDMIGETDRLGRLVGDLLALSAAEAGALELKANDVDARQLVDDLARRVEGIAAKRGITVAVDQANTAVAPELKVVTDRDRLSQLLLIFVDNAMDHSPASATVRLSVAPQVDRGHRYVVIGVADQGPGVPAAERERIFEPFARLQQGARRSAGTGLGLAIARALAGRLGATLKVGEAPGGGATFSVTLPLRA